MNIYPVPILMYHEVLADASAETKEGRAGHGQYYISASLFERHLLMLRERNRVGLSLVDVQRYLAGDLSLSPLMRPIAITFDDGYVGNYTHAHVLLKKHGFTATFFVTTGWMDTAGMMSWEQVRELSREGMAIESHLVTHQFLKYADRESTLCELRDSKESIERELGRPVRFISLPHGSTNALYRGMALSLGYTGGCCSTAGLNRPGSDSFMLKRLSIVSTCRPADLSALLQPGIALMKVIAIQRLKAAIRALLGEKIYKSLYDIVYGKTTAHEDGKGL